MYEWIKILTLFCSIVTVSQPFVVLGSGLPTLRIRARSLDTFVQEAKIRTVHNDVHSSYIDGRDRLLDLLKTLPSRALHQRSCVSYLLLTCFNAKSDLLTFI